MSNLIDTFLADLKLLRNYSPNTIRDYGSELRLFFQSVPIEPTLISEDNIKNYIRSLNCKPSSINKKIAVIKSFFKYLHEQNIIKHNPAEKIKKLKQDKRLPRYIKENTLKDIFSRIERFRDRVILKILFYTGIRVSELVNIKIDDIDFNHKFILISGKGNKQRIVPLTDELIGLIKDYIKQAKVKDYLFKLTPRAIQYITKKYSDSKTTPHMYRHTFATQMVSRGADIRLVQEILGHKNLNTTQIYTHLASESLVSQYQKYCPSI